MKIKKNIYTCVSALLISTMFSACSFTNQQEITSNTIDNQEVKDIDIDVNADTDTNTSENSEIDINNSTNDNRLTIKL